MGRKSECYNHNNHCLTDKGTLGCLGEQNFTFNSSKNFSWWCMGNLVFDLFKMFTSNNSASRDEFVMNTLFVLIKKKLLLNYSRKLVRFSLFGKKRYKLKIFSLSSELRPQ